jgi:hypothetical protein
VRKHAWVKDRKGSPTQNLFFWRCVRCGSKEWSMNPPTTISDFGGLWLQQGTSSDRIMSYVPVDCDEALVKDVMLS